MMDPHVVEALLRIKRISQKSLQRQSWKLWWIHLRRLYELQYKRLINSQAIQWVDYGIKDFLHLETKCKVRAEKIGKQGRFLPVLKTYLRMQFHQKLRWHCTEWAWFSSYACIVCIVWLYIWSKVRITTLGTVYCKEGLMRWVALKIAL